MKGQVNNKLKAAIVEQGKKFPEVAKAINMPNTTFSRKINGHAEFSQTEIEDICKHLNKSPMEIFFANLVTDCTIKAS